MDEHVTHRVNLVMISQANEKSMNFKRVSRTTTLGVVFTVNLTTKVRCQLNLWVSVTCQLFFRYCKFSVNPIQTILYVPQGSSIIPILPGLNS